jgi:hypothetical protein
MAQDLTVNIKTTSDVPQAMDRAKNATVSFERQVSDISRKFSTAFKDIFLGFTAPMVLIQSAISYISAAIEQAKRDAKEGLDLIAQGESRFATSEEAKAAAFFKRKKELDEEKRLVNQGRTEVTRQILGNEGGMFKDFQLPEKYVRQLREGSTTMEKLAQDKEVQRLAMEYFTQTNAGQRITESLGYEEKQKPFKGPEGFGNVIGVGANPVIEAMAEQTEIQKQQLAVLQQIASNGGGVPVDFTKKTTEFPGYGDQM